MFVQRYRTPGSRFQRWITTSDTSGRPGAAVVWLLPALAVLAAAAYWWLNPSPRPALQNEPVATPVINRDQPSPAALNSSQHKSEGQIPRTNPAPVPVKAVSDTKAVDVPMPAPQPAPTGNAIGAEADFVGDWTGYYQGERKLKVTADGEGTMIAKPEGIAATLLAPELTFKILWKLSGDQFEFETVGGEPLDKVNIVVKMYGRRRSHKILERLPNKLVLLDEDGVTKYVWNRVTSQSQPPVAPQN